MTFKTRNSVLLTVFIFSVSLLIAYTALLIFSISENTLVIPTFSDSIFSHVFLADRYTFWAVLASIFVFLIYVPTCVLFLFIQFEKTHSTEVIFFVFFLIGCTCETARLFFPLFNLWHSFSLLSIFLARCILFGRMLSPLSLLFLTLFSESEQRQLVERNIIILLVISVMAASLFPLNTMVILPSFCMQCGDEKLFFSIRIFVLLIACSSIFVKAKNLGHDIKNFIGFTTLALGYFLCCSTFSFVMLILSSLLFVVGTIIYIKELHTHYLWQD